MAMKSGPMRKPRIAAGIIERQDNHVLIVLPAPAQGRPRLWQFPRDLTQPGEPPEAAMRRIALEQLGLCIEIVVGQPPVMASLDGREVELRYFFCGVADGEPHAGPYAEIRWVSKGHLREYEFDAPSQPIVEWMLESP